MYTVHVKGTIKKVLPDDINGAKHQSIIVNNIQGVYKVSEVFCAIRYGDEEGLKSPIPDLKEGAQIELKGEFIATNHGYKQTSNEDPVIHFTHYPVGFVVYNGVKYD